MKKTHWRNIFSILILAFVFGGLAMYNTMSKSIKAIPQFQVYIYPTEGELIAIDTVTLEVFQVKYIEDEVISIVKLIQLKNNNLKESNGIKNYK